MLKIRTPLLVGLLMIGGAFAFIFTFGSLQQGIDEDDTYRVFGRFDDATGLVPNSRVMLSGIEVGRLGEIKLDPQKPDKALVALFIRSDVTLYQGVYDDAARLWKNGATATRQQASLIGDYYVALTPGIAGPKIPDGGLIKNVTSVSGLDAVIGNFENATQSIFPKLEAITEDIKAVTAGLKTTLGTDGAVDSLTKIRADISRTTENVAALTGELRNFLKASVYPKSADVNRILNNVERMTLLLAQTSARSSQQIDRILGGIEGTTKDIRRFIGDQTASAEEAKDGTVAKAISRLDKNMTLLEGSLENVRAISANLEQGRGTVGRLLTDDKLINDIEKVVSDVEDFTSSFSRTQIKVEFRTDYYVSQESFKHTIGFSLHPSPDKYYLLQLVDDPTGKLQVKRRVTVSNNPNVPPVLVEDISERTSDFKITLQFAKRWHFMTFRYGVMESTGGIGIDADLLDDALNFKFDLFDFGRDEYPRLRVLAQWEFATHVFLTAGIDDVLNGDSRSIFAGLGVRFEDDDLKAVGALAPSGL